jgi:hypothetical protein
MKKLVNNLINKILRLTFIDFGIKSHLAENLDYSILHRLNTTNETTTNLFVETLIKAYESDEFFIYRVSNREPFYGVGIYSDFISVWDLLKYIEKPFRHLTLDVYVVHAHQTHENEVMHQFLTKCLKPKETQIVKNWMIED